MPAKRGVRLRLVEVVFEATGARLMVFSERVQPFILVPCPLLRATKEAKALPLGEATVEGLLVSFYAVVAVLFLVRVSTVLSRPISLRRFF